MSGSGKDGALADIDRVLPFRVAPIGPQELMTIFLLPAM
jgi:hypothetical protein